MNSSDKEYIRLVKKILSEGVKRGDRTGTGTIEIFGPQMEFDLQEGFPLLTTKELNMTHIANELFWFLSGSTDLKDLMDRGTNIWNKDGYRFYKEKGGTLEYKDFLEKVRDEGFDLGPIYGYNLRRWEGPNGEVTDQINTLMDSLRMDPESRRHVVTTWNPVVLNKIALPSCHGTTIQLYRVNDLLSCKVYIRSNDIFLGNPYNIASYALLTELIAHTLGIKADKLIITIGSAHIYLNHVEPIKKQIKREPRKLPKLEIKNVRSKLEDYTLEDLTLVGYDPHGPIKGELSVGL